MANGCLNCMSRFSQVILIITNICVAVSFRFVFCSLLGRMAEAMCCMFKRMTEAMNCFEQTMLFCTESMHWLKDHELADHPHVKLPVFLSCALCLLCSSCLV